MEYLSLDLADLQCSFVLDLYGKCGELITGTGSIGLRGP